MTLPDPPSSWNALTKEQLIFIHSLPRSEMEDQVYKLKVFLHLAGLELCNESYYQQPLTPTLSPKGAREQDTETSDVSPEDKLKEIQHQLDWMESVLDGTAPITVVLRPVKNTNKSDSNQLPSSLQGEGSGLGAGAKYSISDQDLFDAVQYFTKFLDEPYTLLSQPLGNIIIGKHTYKTPDPLFANLTYEQYQNAQGALSRFWDAGQNIEVLQQQLKEDAEKHADTQKRLVSFSGGKHKPTEYKPDPNIMQQIEDNLKAIKEEQGEFLVHVLTCMQPTVYDEAILDKDGKPSYTSRGKAKIRQILHLDEPSVDVDKYSRNQKDEIVNESPSYLFPILYQHFQSSLIEHKHNFPKLFSGKGGGSNDNPFVSTISTLNVLMKEQGYNDQRATLDANVVFNFQKLDELTRRAEEMERMNKEMKRKSHK